MLGSADLASHSQRWRVSIPGPTHLQPTAHGLWVCCRCLDTSSWLWILPQTEQLQRHYLCSFFFQGQNIRSIPNHKSIYNSRVCSSLSQCLPTNHSKTWLLEFLSLFSKGLKICVGYNWENCPGRVKCYPQDLSLRPAPGPCLFRLRRQWRYSPKET